MTPLSNNAAAVSRQSAGEPGGVKTQALTIYTGMDGSEQS
jgi:hypothetical protein